MPTNYPGRVASPNWGPEGGFTPGMTPGNIGNVQSQRVTLPDGSIMMNGTIVSGQSAPDNQLPGRIASPNWGQGGPQMSPMMKIMANASGGATGKGVNTEGHSPFQRNFQFNQSFPGRVASPNWWPGASFMNPVSNWSPPSQLPAATQQPQSKTQPATVDLSFMKPQGTLLDEYKNWGEHWGG